MGLISWITEEGRVSIPETNATPDVNINPRGEHSAEKDRMSTLPRVGIAVPAGANFQSGPTSADLHANSIKAMDSNESQASCDFGHLLERRRFDPLSDG